MLGVLWSPAPADVVGGSDEEEGDEEAESEASCSHLRPSLAALMPAAPAAPAAATAKPACAAHAVRAPTCCRMRLLVPHAQGEAPAPKKRRASNAASSGGRRRSSAAGGERKPGGFQKECT